MKKVFLVLGIIVGFALSASATDKDQTSVFKNFHKKGHYVNTRVDRFV